MEFLVLHSSRIDPGNWNRLVSKSSEPSLYNTFDYLNLCEGDWEAVVGSDEGLYFCAMVFPYRLKAGIKYIYQSPSIPYLCPISASPIDGFETRWKAHLKTFQYVAKFFVRLDSLDSPGIQTTNRAALELNLQRDYQTIASQYSKSRKVRLQQSKINGQQVVLSRDLDMFISGFKENTLPKIEGMTESQQLGINKLWMKLKENEQVEVYYATQGLETVAGVLLGKYEATLYYVASYSNQIGRQLNGVTLLMDFIISKYALGNFTRFDLGYAEVPGITEFKRDFGASPYTVSQVYWNSMPWFIRIPKLVLNWFGIAVGAR